MKMIILHFLILFIFLAPKSYADKILDNDCFEVSKDGRLIHLDQAAGCYVNSNFTDSQAEGLSTGHAGADKFAISIQKKSKDDFQVYEFAPDPINWDISASMRAAGTHVKNGSVTDQTICTRYLEKVKPIVGTDSLTCVTVNQTFCSNFYKVANTIPDYDLSTMKQCQSIIDWQMTAMDSAVTKSWKNDDYKSLAQTRYDEMRAATSPHINSKLLSDVKWSFNDSKQTPESGTLKFRDIGSGYSWMQSMFDHCLKNFPPPQKSGSGADKQKSAH